MMDTATLKGLLEKATKGPMVDQSGSEGFVLVNKDGYGFRCGRHDAALIVALRNNAEELIASAERCRQLDSALTKLLIAEKFDDDDPRLIGAREQARQALGGAK